jgi:hypothetical protein
LFSADVCPDHPFTTQPSIKNIPERSIVSLNRRYPVKKKENKVTEMSRYCPGLPAKTLQKTAGGDGNNSGYSGKKGNVTGISGLQR